MNLSNEIAELLSAMLERDGMAEIKRNELAQQLGCVPSQINYVITSRFTPERGYIVESRRGGGGYVKITRINCTARQMVMHVLNSIGDVLDEGSANAIISGLARSSVITEEQERIMLAASSDKNFAAVSADSAKKVRAALVKRMLLECSLKGRNMQ